MPILQISKVPTNGHETGSSSRRKYVQYVNNSNFIVEMLEKAQLKSLRFSRKKSAFSG